MHILFKILTPTIRPRRIVVDRPMMQWYFQVLELSFDFNLASKMLNIFSNDFFSLNEYIV